MITLKVTREEFSIIMSGLNAHCFWLKGLYGSEEIETIVKDIHETIRLRDQLRDDAKVTGKRFTCTINMDNAAFGDDHESNKAELRKIFSRMLHGETFRSMQDLMNIRDSNGNIVGEARIEEVDHGQA